MNIQNKKPFNKSVQDSQNFDDDIQETNLDQVKHNEWLESQNSKDLEKIAKNAGDWMRKKMMTNKAQD